MGEVVQIPRTIRSAERALGGIDGLLTAKEWERAAIVYAFTYEGKAGNPNLTTSREIGSDQQVSDQQLTIIEFTKEEINGLRTQDAVRHYRSAWKTAIRQGKAADIRPGQKAALPDSKFPPFRPNIQNPTRREALLQQAEADGLEGPGKVLDVASNPKAVASALKADSEFAKRVVKDSDVLHAVTQAVIDNATDEADLRNPARAHASPARPANRSEPPTKTVLRELTAAKAAHDAHVLVGEVIAVWHLLSDEAKDAVKEEWEPMLREIDAAFTGLFSDDELAALLREG
jgi:hypothetical protein